jgi:predicted RNase H-like HicB family nuclease
MNATRYAIIIERGPTSYGAYSPDVPGCVAAAKTEQEVRKLIAEAIEFHIEGLRLRGEPVPEPTSTVDYVEVAA